MLPLLRYTLDLFEHLAPAAQTPVLQKPAKLPPPPLSFTPPLAAVPAFDPGQALADALAPVRFVHPKANREVRIGDAVVAYAFTRAKRRSIGFVVGVQGLAVRAPQWTPLHEVEAALQEKGRWILRKLQETQQRQHTASHARIDWADGVVIPYLGTGMRITLDPTHGFQGKGAHLMALPESHPLALPQASAAVPEQPRYQLLVGLPTSASAEQIRDAVQAWLMQQAKALFTRRMEHFAQRLQVRWTRLRLSNAGTRWGSASADGSIRLHWRLVHFRLPVIDYVVAHELSHLRVMNHSPRFWDTVATVVPDYVDLRRELKGDVLPAW